MHDKERNKGNVVRMKTCTVGASKRVEGIGIGGKLDANVLRDKNNNNERRWLE